MWTQMPPGVDADGRPSVPEDIKSGRQVTRGVQGPSRPWLPEGESSLWSWLLGGTSSQSASCIRFSPALVGLLSAGF